MQTRARELAAHRRARRERGEGGRRSTPSVAIDGARLDVELSGGGRTASIGAALRAWQAGVDLVPLDRRRLGPRADGVVRQARRARRRSARDRAATTTACRSTRCPISRSCARISTSRRRPSSIALRPLLDGFAGIPHVAAEPASSASCGRTSSAASTGSRSVATPASAACSPTTWASARRSRRSRRSAASTLVVSPTSVLFNWLAETTQVPPRSRGSRPTTARAARSIDRRRHRADQLSAPAQRHRRARRASTWDTVILDESQTIKNPDSQVARAAYRLQGALARHAVRHADREPARRAVEPAPLHEPRPARRPHRLPGALGASRSSTAMRAAAARLRERIRPFVLRRHEARGRERAAAAHRRDHVRRARRGRARRPTTRSAPRPSARSSRCSRPAAA